MIWLAVGWPLAGPWRSMFSQARQDRPGTRLTLQAEFVWGYEPDAKEYPAFEEGQPEAVERAALDLLGASDRDEVPIEFSARPEGLGRGAEGPAIALVIATATLVASQVLTWLDVAERVARAWKWVRTKHRPPVLSLGAVVLLTATDLHERLENMNGVEVLWAGDVTGMAEVGDLIYSGEDIYGVIYTREGQMWIYIVDDIGQLIHFGDGRQHPHSGLRFLPGSGEWVGADAPDEPPNMLLNSTDHSEDPDDSDDT